MKNSDFIKEIKEAAEKAKPLFKIRDSGRLQEQMNILKQILKEDGLEEGIFEIRIFCENKEKKEKLVSTINSSNVGSYILYVEYFNF